MEEINQKFKKLLKNYTNHVTKKKDDELKKKDDMLKEAEDMLKEKDDLLKEKDDLLKEKDQEIERLKIIINILIV